MKKKLILDMDALRVESIEPSRATEPLQGTVRAHEEPNGAIGAASVSYCQPCFTQGGLCQPLTTYRCA